MTPPLTAATPTGRHRRAGPGNPRGPRGSERAAWWEVRAACFPGSGGVGDLMELVVGRRRDREREGSRGRCGPRPRAGGHLLTWRRADAGDLVDTVLGTPGLVILE